MGRNQIEPLPRTPNDDGDFRMLMCLIGFIIFLSCLIFLVKCYRAAGGSREAPPSEKSIPSPTVPNRNA